MICTRLLQNCLLRAGNASVLLALILLPSTLMLAGEAWGPDSMPEYPDPMEQAIPGGSGPYRPERFDWQPPPRLQSERRQHKQKKTTAKRRKIIRPTQRTAITKSRQRKRAKRLASKRRAKRATSRSRRITRRSAKPVHRQPAVRTAAWQRRWVHQRKSLMNKSTLLPLHGSDYKNRKKLLVQGEPIKPNTANVSLASFIRVISKQKLAPVPSFLYEFKRTAAKPPKPVDKKLLAFDDPSDYLPGYYKQPMYAQLGKSFISLYPIALLSNGSPQPNYSRLSVYRQYTGPNSHADKRLNGTVSIYLNNKKILYRWIADYQAAKQSGILGIDILLRRLVPADFKQTRTVSMPAQLYYLQHGRARVKFIQLNLQLAKSIEIR